MNNESKSPAAPDRMQDDRLEALYVAWKAGELTDYEVEQLRRELDLAGSLPSRQAGFADLRRLWNLLIQGFQYAIADHGLPEKTRGRLRRHFQSGSAAAEARPPSRLFPSVVSVAALAACAVLTFLVANSMLQRQSPRDSGELAMQQQQPFSEIRDELQRLGTDDLPLAVENRISESLEQNSEPVSQSYYFGTAAGFDDSDKDMLSSSIENRPMMTGGLPKSESSSFSLDGSEAAEQPSAVGFSIVPDRMAGESKQVRELDLFDAAAIPDSTTTMDWTDGDEFSFRDSEKWNLSSRAGEQSITDLNAVAGTSAGRLFRFSQDLPKLAVSPDADRLGLYGGRPSSMQRRKSGQFTPVDLNVEKETAESPISTFSMNVGDASFRLAESSLQSGTFPDKNSIRTEEFVNAMDYHDPAVRHAPVGVFLDRAQWPFETDRQLLRIAVAAAVEGLNRENGLNLVVLLDTSGSMERPDRKAVTQSVLQVIANELGEGDLVSLVGFSSAPTLWVDSLPGIMAAELTARAGDIQPSGGTNIEAALNLAYEKLYQNFRPEAANRVLLLTDGAANLGELRSGALRELVEENRRRGAALDCFGIGWDGLDDRLLEELTRHSDGRYGVLVEPVAAAEQFRDTWFKSLKVAARDVKVQVRFNPSRVTRYRQLGFNRHQLSADQFRDNSVDAGELSKAETGNALYVIQVDEDNGTPLGWVTVRYLDPSTGQYRETERTIEFAWSAPSMEDATPALKLAASAAALAEWMAGSPYSDQVALDRLDAWVSDTVLEFSPDPGPVRLREMIRMARSMEPSGPR